MHTRRRIPRLFISLLAGAAGLVVFAAPAGAQVDLTGPTGTEPVEGAIDETLDEAGTTVTTVVAEVEDAVGEVEETVGEEGVTVELPGTTLEVDAPDLLTDPVGSLDSLVDDGSADPSSVSGTHTIADSSAESARTDGDSDGSGGAPAGDAATPEGPARREAVPGVVTGGARPFVLTARDVGTFGLPLVVAGLLCAYLGMDSWMRRREPVAVPVVDERDERLRFE